MDKETLQLLMLYAHIDDESESPLLEMLYNSADSYMRNAGVTEDLVDPSQRQLCVFAMTAFWYDHRTTAGDASKLPTWLKDNVRQLEDAADCARAALAMGEG